MKKSQIVIKSALVSKNTAYLGEIGRKVELSKRRKLQTPKKINLNSFKKLYRYKIDAKLSGSIRLPTFGSTQKQSGGLANGWPVDKGLSSNFKKYSLYFKKKAWYRDKAAPIPGGNQKLSTGYLRKEKFYKKIFRAYRLFKTYLNFNKKGLNKLCKKIVINKDSMDFSTLMYMDSLFYSSMQKSCIGTVPATKLQVRYFLNGKYVTKKNFVLYRKNKVLMHQALQ